MIHFYSFKKGESHGASGVEKEKLEINLIKERLSLNDPQRILWYLFKVVDRKLGDC